jgi:hypothetical protein
MGWWKVEHTEDLVGDEVFDILRRAMREVAGLYNREFDRRPTRTEWQRLVCDALEPEEEIDSSISISLFAENVRPKAIEIIVERILNGAD